MNSGYCSVEVVSVAFSRDLKVTETMSDENLAKLAREGSEKALSMLVSRCVPMVKHLAGTFRCQQIETEDLAQEGFMGLLSAVRTYEPSTALFRTYAAVCVRHRMLSAVKRSGSARLIPQSELVSMDDELETSLVSNGVDDPAQLVVQKEEALRLNKQLHKLLSPREYDVFYLYLGAYTYEEIAQRMKMSTKAVDNALQRVRRKFSSVSLFYGLHSF